jgi:hypothetical protein
LVPDTAFASGAITEFSSPLERVVNTVTGPAGKWISIVAMALCGIVFIMNKNDNNCFLSSHKVYFIFSNHIVTRSLFPVCVPYNPAKSVCGAGRLAGTFLVSVALNNAWK